MTTKTYLIFGISKGLGKFITLNLPSPNDTVFGVSRTQPDYLSPKTNNRWIKTDLAKLLKKL